MTVGELGARGSALWVAITEAHQLDPAQLEVLREACRSADRLDGLDDIIAGRGLLGLLRARGMVDDEAGGDVTVVLTVDSVLSEARQQQTVFKQLIAALRLPDVVSGARPKRAGERGAYVPSGAKVSSLDRARARAAGSAG